MASFFRNPSGRPVTATALEVLSWRACLSPAMILLSLRPEVSRCCRELSTCLIISSICAVAETEQASRIRTSARELRIEIPSEDVVSKGILAVERVPGKMQVGRLRTVANGLAGAAQPGRAFLSSKGCPWGAGLYSVN